MYMYLSLNTMYVSLNSIYLSYWCLFFSVADDHVKVMTLLRTEFDQCTHEDIAQVRHRYEVKKKHQKINYTHKYFVSELKLLYIRA